MIPALHALLVGRGYLAAAVLAVLAAFTPTAVCLLAAVVLLGLHFRRVALSKAPAADAAP